MKYNKIVISVLLLIFVIGCNAGTKKGSAIGLKLTKDTLIATATTAKRLCDSEIIGAADCKNIEELYTTARALLIEAKEIWDIMVELDDFQFNEDYDDLIMKVAELTWVIENIIRKEREHD